MSRVRPGLARPSAARDPLEKVALSRAEMRSPVLLRVEFRLSRTGLLAELLDISMAAPSSEPRAVGRLYPGAQHDGVVVR